MLSNRFLKTALAQTSLPGGLETAAVEEALGRKRKVLPLPSQALASLLPKGQGSNRGSIERKRTLAGDSHRLS